MKGGLPTSPAEIRERLLTTSDVMLESLLEREEASIPKLESYLAAARLRAELILEEMKSRVRSQTGGEDDSYFGPCELPTGHAGVYHQNTTYVWG